MSRANGQTSEVVASFLFEEVLTDPEKAAIQDLIGVAPAEDLAAETAARIAGDAVLELDAEPEDEVEGVQQSVNLAIATFSPNVGGSVIVSVTNDRLDGNVFNFAVNVTGPNYNGTTLAGIIRAQMLLETSITALFTVSGSGANVTLTSILAVANDPTFNIHVESGTSTGTLPQDSFITVEGVAAVTGTAADYLGQDAIVNEEEFYKCVRISPVKWVGPFPA